MSVLLASVPHKYAQASCSIDHDTHILPPFSIDQERRKVSKPPMASSSSFLLAAAAVAALLVVGSCGSALNLKIGKGSSANKLVIETNVAISEVSIKDKGAMDWSDDLKESSANTWTLDSKEPLKGPISVRFAVKGGGYRVVDDVIPAGFKPGSVYKTGVQI